MTNRSLSLTRYLLLIRRLHGEVDTEVIQSNRETGARSSLICLQLEGGLKLDRVGVRPLIVSRNEPHTQEKHSHTRHSEVPIAFIAPPFEALKKKNTQTYVEV